MTKFCVGVEDRKPEVEAEMEKNAQETLDNLKEINPDLYLKYSKYSDEKKAEEFKKQINREKAKSAKNTYLRNIKWNVIMRQQLNDLIDSKSWICSEFRNKAAHLEVARYAHLYINDTGEVNSYFQLYHYIMQRIIINEITSNSKADIIWNRIVPKVTE